MGVLIIGDNGIQNSVNPATRSAPWPLMAAKAATGIRRMHQSTYNRVATCRELLNQSSFQMLTDYINVTVKKKFVG